MSKQRGTPLTEGQYRVLAHPLRIRILHELASAERTAAQVADRLGETRGNVHYHIQKLHTAGLLDLTHTAANGGILERYYRAATTRFHLAEPSNGPASGAMSLITWLDRTAAEAETLFETLAALLGAWERVGSTAAEAAETWKVTVRLERVPRDDAPAPDGDPAPTEA
jgi:DNA-binding transcriptional ArsR family regulator